MRPRGEALLKPTCKRPFTQPAHQFDADQGRFAPRFKRFEPYPRPCDSLRSISQIPPDLVVKT